MKYRIYLFILTTFMLVQVSCKKEPATNDLVELTAVQRQVIKGSNGFSFNLLRVIDSSSAASENILVSPLSINVTLGMALNGAQGQTKLQMLRVMGLETLEPADINQSYKDLLDLFPTIDNSVKLDVANSMWLNNHYTINPAFEQVNQLYFNSMPQSANFDDAATVNRINNWVAQATHNRVTGMVSALDPQASWYLINASYFQASWTNNFDPFYTRQQDFVLSNGNKVQVPTMYTDNQVAYYYDNHVQVAELSYASGKYSFIAVLPMADNTVENIIEDLNDDTWSNWMAGLDNSTGAKLWLPQMKLEYNASLNGPLSEMGMEVAFSDGADFSTVSSPKPFINGVKHKTYLEVNEDGTSAAATTSVSFLPTGFDESTHMVVNRPFLVAVIEKTTGAILFIGKVANPGQ